VFKSARLGAWLDRRSGTAFVLYASGAAFAAYSCMYAFRKPFAVGHFAGLEFLGMDYKTLIVIAQVIGYMLSKFLGIRVIAELGRTRRPLLLLVLIGSAEAALVLFAVVSPPWNFVFLFLNGIPLGMVWGVVFSYLEGRRSTDLMTLGLCVSFIVASGFVKTVGKWILGWGVSEFAMPALAGALFFLPLLICAFLLENLPPPSADDEALKTRRIPMSGADRKAFFTAFFPGLILMIAAYLLLTAYRDFRDNYMADIWEMLGFGRSAAVFTATEVPVAAGVLVLLALIMRVRDNYRALVINHLAVFGGFVVVGLATLLFQAGLLSAPVWMALVGFGLFLGYVPFNGIIYDRLIAVFRYPSNAGYLIYVGDFVGYLASVVVLGYKSFFQKTASYYSFFVAGSYVLSLVGSVLTALSLAYFASRRKAWPPGSPAGRGS
jgi:hypothetical protein